MSLLSSVDGDEVSPVERAANRRRFALLKGDSEMPDAELQDMLAVPWEFEGTMIDYLRKEGADESVQKAMLAVVRLAKGIEDEVPEAMQIVENLSKAMYSEEDDEGKEDVDADDVEKGDDPSAEARPEDGGRAMSLKARAKAIGLTKQLTRKAVGKADDAASEPEVSVDEDGNVTKEEALVDEPTKESPAVSVPVQKEDGTWDLSNVPEEARAVWSAVLKSNESLGEELQKAKEEITKTRDELDTREYIAKADEKFDVLAPASELGPLLKAAAAGMDEESYGKLEEILSGAAERVRKGDLFEEKGKAVLNDGSRTDAYSTAVLKAKELVEKSTDGLSEDAAITKVFEQNPDLYSKYLVEMAGGS